MMASSTAYNVLKHWREAATLILVSPTASSTQSKLSFVLTSSANTNNQHQRQQIKGTLTSNACKEKLRLDEMSQDYNVLMLKRSTESKFMPGMNVFPGGVATDNDFSSDWLSIFLKLGENFQQSLFHKLALGSAVAAPMFQRQRDSSFSHIPPEVAFRICAIRETFEESGILIASPVHHIKDVSSLVKESTEWSYSPSLGPSNNQLMKMWRERVNKDPDEFLNMCKELEIIPAIWTLHEWSNWLTPVSAVETGRRFDTIFYICCLDHKQEAIEDASETVDSLWAQPSWLLSSYYKNRLTIAPPQIYELSRLLNFYSHASLMNYSAQRDSKRVERWLPVVIICKDALASIMPGDDLYPKNEELSQTVPVFLSDVTFEKLCQQHPGLHRHYRMINTDSSKKSHHHFHTFCNIDIGRGQIAPLTVIENQIHFKSKM